MKRKELLGVWRLVRITDGGRPIETSQTHMVVGEDELWEVWPEETYYEGEAGPEKAYRFSKGVPARLEVQVPRGKYCYLVTRKKSRLRMRLGGVFGHFPGSIDDESGSLYEYERVTGDEADALGQPPPRVGRRTISHPKLGELAYDANIDWWTTSGRFGGAEVSLRVTVDPEDDATEAFDAAAEIFAGLDHEALRAYAASRLLELHNEDWRRDDEAPIDAATFASRITPESIVIAPGSSTTVWFSDDDLFWGHGIHVNLDAQHRPHAADIAG